MTNTKLVCVCFAAIVAAVVIGAPRLFNEPRDVETGFEKYTRIEARLDAAEAVNYPLAYSGSPPAHGNIILAPRSDPPRGDLNIVAGDARRCIFPGMAGPHGYGNWDVIVPKDAGPETCCKLVVVPCEDPK